MSFLYPPRPKIRIFLRESLRKRMENILEEARDNKGDLFWNNIAECIQQTLDLMNKESGHNILMPHVIEEEI